MSKAEERRAFHDAQRSYLFEGGKGAGRLSELLDSEFDEYPETPTHPNSGPMDLVDIFKRWG